MYPFKKGSQNDRLLTHMLGGRRITRYEAMLMFRVQNITARISDLVKAGFQVKTTIKTDPNNQTYAEYSL